MNYKMKKTPTNNGHLNKQSVCCYNNNTTLRR